MKKIKSWFPGKRRAGEEHDPLTQFQDQGNNEQHVLLQEVQAPPRTRPEPGSISPEDDRLAAEDLGDTDNTLVTDNPLIL